MQTQNNGIKFQESDILLFPTWWPLPMGPMRPKNCTKTEWTQSICKEVQFSWAEPMLFCQWVCCIGRTLLNYGWSYVLRRSGGMDGSWSIGRRWGKGGLRWCLKMSRQPPLLTERIQEWWAEQEELLQNEEKTLSATFATSVSKSWEGSELSTGIPCAAQPCGAATEEGEGTASDSFSCISCIKSKMFAERVYWKEWPRGNKGHAYQKLQNNRWEVQCTDMSHSYP